MRWVFLGGQQLSATLASHPVRMTFLVGVALLAVFFFDGRWGFAVLGGAFLLLALAPARLTAARLTATGVALEFQKQLASEIVVLARHPDAPAGEAGAQIGEASIRAAARAISEANNPAEFVHLLTQFLDMRWKSGPAIEPAPTEAAVPRGQRYAASYSGESLFLHLRRGEAGQFAVVFFNEGTEPWVVGTGSQATLARPPGAPDHSSFAAGWLTATDYASQSSDRVPPGTNGFFIYNVQVPRDAALGVYRFHFRLVSRVGVLWEGGGYQDVKVIE